MDSKTFQVPNIGCDGCVRTIQNEIAQVAGVSEVKADRDSKMVTVKWAAPASWQEIETRLTEIDYAPAQA
ncbi:MAG: heavy-metal-associated domain-containing protein [Pleurocapsa minor GSE-CHR-MK-17-07R]|jgi:copper chaperone CopZ|nr:heavy-metal-associated domain-containing protein [Pleurocapsa minor GSE-CHR-MK 17-07R]